MNYPQLRLEGHGNVQEAGTISRKASVRGVDQHGGRVHAVYRPHRSPGSRNSCTDMYDPGLSRKEGGKRYADVNHEATLVRRQSRLRPHRRCRRCTRTSRVRNPNPRARSAATNGIPVVSVRIRPSGAARLTARSAHDTPGQGHAEGKAQIPRQHGAQQPIHSSRRRDGSRGKLARGSVRPVLRRGLPCGRAVLPL